MDKSIGKIATEVREPARVEMGTESLLWIKKFLKDVLRNEEGL